IEQRPFACAIRAAREKDFEGVVALDTNATPASVAKQKLHFRRPLRMRRPAQAKAVREQTSPVIARAQIAFRETRAPQILGAFLAVRVMRVAPEPRGQRFLLIVLWLE